MTKIIRLTEGELCRIIKNSAIRLINEDYSKWYGQRDDNGDIKNPNHYLNTFEYACETLINGNISTFKEMKKAYDEQDWDEFAEFLRESGLCSNEYFMPNFIRVCRHNENEEIQNIIHEYMENNNTFCEGKHYIKEEGEMGGAPNASISACAMYDVPLGGRGSSKVQRRTFFTAGNTEKTMQHEDEEGTDVVNKKKK